MASLLIKPDLGAPAASLTVGEQVSRTPASGRGTKGPTMAAVSAAGYARPPHPLHAILLAFPFPLFLGALISDFAYRSSFEVQWSNFSSWLITGGLIGGGFALLWALVDLIRSRDLRRRGAAIYFLALLAMWGIAFIDVLVHAKDAFAIMPEALYLSAVATALALGAAWMGYSGHQQSGHQQREAA